MIHLDIIYLDLIGSFFNARAMLETIYLVGLF
jgi:hypothetical protein